MNKKALSTMEYIFGTFSTLILTVFLILFFSLVLRSCSHEVTEHMIEKEVSALHKEAFNLYLITPINLSKSTNYFYESSYFYDNKNLTRHYSLSLNLDNQDKNFQIKVNDINKIKNINIDFHHGKYSNIALINGSSDNLLPLLEKELKFPDIIVWDELSEKHKYVIAGSNSPQNYNKTALLDWISNGGKLITTTHSIKIIEDLFDKEFIYPSKNFIKSENIEISFKNNAENIIGLKDDKIIDNLFSLAIKNKSLALAEYKNIDNEFCKRTKEGCGYPILYFDHEQGKVIHFSFNLNSNEEIANIFLNKIKPEYNEPDNIKLYDEYNNEIANFENNIYFLLDLFEPINLIEQFKDCEDECYKTFTIKGDGNIILRQPKMEIKNSLYFSYQQSLADYIIEAFSRNDTDMINNVKKITENFVNSISTNDLAHRFTFVLPGGNIIQIPSDKFRSNIITSSTDQANIDLKLYNNQTISLHLESAPTTSTVLRGALDAFKISIRRGLI